jgi:hypothetical protein
MRSICKNCGLRLQEGQDIQHTKDTGHVQYSVFFEEDTNE